MGATTKEEVDMGQNWRELGGTSGSLVNFELTTFGAFGATTLFMAYYLLWCATPHPCTHYLSSFQADVLEACAFAYMHRPAITPLLS